MGNRIDTKERYREVTREEGGSYALEFDILYFETSACVSTDIHHVLNEIGKCAYSFNKFIVPKNNPRYRKKKHLVNFISK